MNLPVLSQLEARVLGVLVEKQRSVPDTYPLTLNALTAGCNQKSSRDPILAAAESDVQQALDALKSLSLVVETSGGRVMRYAHNTERVLALPAQSVALLATLMLRGPQTAAELRVNADRLHRFADVSAVEAFLHELAQREEAALVAELPRAPGTRETRWTQLLTGRDVAARPGEASAASSQVEVRRTDSRTDTPHDAPSSALRELEQGLAALREEVDALRSEIAALRKSANE